MAVTTAAVTVGTTPTLLATGSKNGIHSAKPVEVYNDGTATIFVGGSNVAASGATKGRPIAVAESAVFELESGDDLYGIVAAATQSAIVLTLRA